MKNRLSAIKLLGVTITDETEDTILKYILQRLKTTRDKFFIVTPNPEIIVYANKRSDYKTNLISAAVSLPDGTGVFLGSLVLGHWLHQRIPGVDFIDFICQKTKDQPISMGFLGGRHGVAEKTVKCLKKKYPWINVAFVGEEWPKEAYSTKSAGIDMLFVAFGFPRQEEWIYENLDRLPVRCAMGVGGAFDYISGHVQRAPFLVRVLGFEWLYRLIKQPWRWRRQAALIEFVRLLLKERLKKKKIID